MTSDVAAAPDSTEAPKTKIFISYSRNDAAFADRLEQALKARGFYPLIDRSDIDVFEDWWRRIQNLIVQADTVVAVLSPDYLSSDTCRKEVRFAASRHKRFAPLEYRPVETKFVPGSLERLDFEFVNDSGQFEQNMDRLAEALQTDIDWIRKHTEFGAWAHDWVDQGRPPGLLLRSPVLEEAERWIALRPRDAPMPTAETQAFIAASRRATLRQRDLRIAVLTGGLLLALGFAGVLSWHLWSAAEAQRRNQRALDTTRQMANALVLDLGRDPRLLSLLPDLARRTFDRAIEGYDQVIMLAPTDAKTYNDRGNAFFERANLDGNAADYDRAFEDYDQAIRFDPNYAAAYSNRCWAGVVVAKQLQRALSDCDQALRIDPQDIRARDNRGFAYLKLGRLDDAIESFNAALKIDPNSPTARYGRGLAEMKSGDAKDAEADMAAATAIQADVADYLARYGIK